MTGLDWIVILALVSFAVGVPLLAVELDRWRLRRRRDAELRRIYREAACEARDNAAARLRDGGKW